jgi:hypothetical protein
MIEKINNYLISRLNQIKNSKKLEFKRIEKIKIFKNEGLDKKHFYILTNHNFE